MKRQNSTVTISVRNTGKAQIQEMCDSYKRSESLLDLERTRISDHKAKGSDAKRNTTGCCACDTVLQE